MENKPRTILRKYYLNSRHDDLILKARLKIFTAENQRNRGFYIFLCIECRIGIRHVRMSIPKIYKAFSNYGFRFILHIDRCSIAEILIPKVKVDIY